MTGQIYTSLKSRQAFPNETWWKNHEILGFFQFFSLSNWIYDKYFLKMVLLQLKLNSKNILWILLFYFLFISITYLNFLFELIRF